MLIENAAMPKAAQVTGSNWIVVAHELRNPSSTQVQYNLYYNFSDLMNAAIAQNAPPSASWTAPLYNGNPNGTPSIYDFSMQNHDGYFTVDGQYGFHFRDTTVGCAQDAVTTITKMFDPTGGVTSSPSTAAGYNSVIKAAGAVSCIGGRDTLQTTTTRFNLQEGNTDANVHPIDYGAWSVFLYTFSESTLYPTGAGTAVQLHPITAQTTGGNYSSFGDPTVNVVDTPGGTGGQTLVVSYYIFGKGAYPGEAASLIFFFNL